MKLNCDICGSEIEADNACKFVEQLVDEWDEIKKEHEQNLCQSCAKAVAIAITEALYEEEIENDGKTIESYNRLVD